MNGHVWERTEPYYPSPITDISKLTIFAKSFDSQLSDSIAAEFVTLLGGRLELYKTYIKKHAGSLLLDSLLSFLFF